MIWERLIKWEQETIRLLNKELMEYEEPGMDRFNKPGWTNRTWKNEFIRRAHVDVVDARDTKGLWMAHVCLFPELTNGGPIYGFDIIAGKKLAVLVPDSVGSKYFDGGFKSSDPNPKTLSKFPFNFKSFPQP